MKGIFFEKKNLLRSFFYRQFPYGLKKATIYLNKFEGHNTSHLVPQEYLGKH